jgi:hypothetical protein
MWYKVERIYMKKWKKKKKKKKKKKLLPEFKLKSYLCYINYKEFILKI